MKYIVAQLGNLKFPVLFPDALTHSSVASGLHNLSQNSRVVSAGFYSVHKTGKVATFGKSESLGNLAPQPIDAQLITCCLLGEEALLPFYCE